MNDNSTTQGAAPLAARPAVPPPPPPPRPGMFVKPGAPASTPTPTAPTASAATPPRTPQPPASPAASAAPTRPVPPASPRAQGLPPPPCPADHPWANIFHAGRVSCIVDTTNPALVPYIGVPFQVMRIQADRNSFVRAPRGMLVAIETTWAQSRGLEPNLWLFLPDDDADTTYNLDPAYDGWSQYTFLNTVVRQSVFTAWNIYQPLSALCPGFVPPARPAYSYVNATRTMASGMPIGWNTPISGMFFGLGFALAVTDPFYDYYYRYPGLMFSPGFGYYDPLYYELGLTGALVATELAMTAGFAGVALGLGIVAGIEIAEYALGWGDPYMAYEGVGLYAMTPGGWAYGSPALGFDPSYAGGILGADGASWAVSDFNGATFEPDGFAYAPHDEGMGLADPGQAYTDFGGTGLGDDGVVNYGDGGWGGGDTTAQSAGNWQGGDTTDQPGGGDWSGGDALDQTGGGGWSGGDALDQTGGGGWGGDTTDQSGGGDWTGGDTADQSGGGDWTGGGGDWTGGDGT